MKRGDDSGQGRPSDAADLLEKELGDSVVDADAAVDDDVEIDYGDESLWDDLPETEIEVGDDEEFVIEDFDEASLGVYEGLTAEEDIAAGVEASEDDEDVVIESGEDDDEDAFGIDDSFLDEEALWSQQQWAECAGQLVDDAREMDDPSHAARLLAEAGRIHEVRLGQVEEAVRLMTSAHELDPGCLPAIQGLRRCHLAGGDVDSARQLLDEEKALAEDLVVRDRIEGLDLEIRSWKLDDQEEAARGLARTGAGRGDVYPELVKLCVSFLAGDAAGASGAARAVVASASDGLFVSTLESAAGLLAEVAGEGEAADAAYGASLEARAGDEAALCARWRMHVADRAWAEAARAADLPGLDPAHRLARGHGFLRAALEILALARPQEARSLLAPLPDGLPEKALLLLASLEDAQAFDGTLGELESRLPEGRLAAVLAWRRASEMDDDPAIDVLRGVLEQAPDLDAVSLDLSLRLARREAAGRASLLDALIDDAVERPGSTWLVTEVGLTLLEEDRAEEAVRIIDRILEREGGDQIVWPVILKLLAVARNDLAARMLETRVQGIDDEVMREAVELAREAVLLEEGDAGSSGGLAPAPAAFAALREGSIDDPDERLALLQGILETEPAHTLAFAALRRELLAAGRVEEYGRALEAWADSSDAVSDRIQGERVALLSLGVASSLGEDELRSHLEASGDDTFLPLFIAGLEGFASLAAESTERIASGLEGEAADRWWFDAARRWVVADPNRAAAALGRVGDSSWKAAADGLLEASSWVSGRWDEAAGRLIAAMRELPEGEQSEQILTRMIYVDGFLKGETSMALAEAESLRQVEDVTGLFCLRFLYTELLAQGRLEELDAPLEAMARFLAGSDESSAFAWLTSRVLGRGDEAREQRADALVRDVLEARAQDLPLLLLADSQARRTGDRELLASVLSEMAGAMEGDREQGGIMWVLALMFLEKDPERALSLAREAQEKLPSNPVAALLVEQVAAARGDWATAAAFARQAASLTRQLAFGVEDFLRAGEIYRDRLEEGGWAVQCFESAVSLDPSDSRGFGTLRDHFASQGDWDRVATLLEERILAVEGDEDRHELLRELAGFYEQAGRQEEAIASFRRILADHPEDPKSLSSLAGLCMRAGLWEEAVSNLQERAMLPMTDEESVEVFRKLGGLYVDQVPNDQRAIVCFEKVFAAGEKDQDVMRQLAALYEKTGAWEKGLKIAELLYNDAEEDEEKARWLVVAGRLWQTGGGDLRRAEQTFEMARKLVPGLPEPVVALVRLYREQGDQRALAFHLERSLGDLKVFASSDPGNLALYHTVFQIALESGVARDVRIAGTLLEGLFDLHADERVPYDDAGGLLSWSAGPWLAEPAQEDVLAPKSFTPSFRVLVARLRDVILKSVGYDAKQYGISRATRLAKRFSGDTGLNEEIARHFGIKPLQVHATDLIPNSLTVLPDSPPILVVGEPLYRSLDESQKRFVFAWGCRLAASGLVPFVSMTEANLPALWVALVQQFEPSYFVSGVSADETAALSASLHKNFPRKAREELLGPALECAGDQLIDVANLYADITGYADAAALLACGDIRGALQFVWQVSSMDEPFASDYAAAKALRESPALARLVEFIMSGRFSRCLPGEE
jgi:tetratricopeptide (TPR) repeat protein